MPSDYVTLIRSVRDGDMAAFRQLYDDAGPSLYATVVRILPNAAAAQDAMQDGFLRIWRNAHRYDPTLGHPMAWMTVIMRNAALDVVRRRRDEWDIDAIDGDSQPVVQPVAPDHLLLTKLLRQIPPEQANAIAAMYTYGFSHAELAAHLGAPLGTVKSWVRRGTASLQQLITP